MSQFAVHHWNLALIPHQCIDGGPHVHDSGPLGRQHAILQTIKILAIDGRDEFAGEETEKHTWRKVVLAYAGAKLEVLVKHGAEGQRNRLVHMVS